MTKGQRRALNELWPRFGIELQAGLLNPRSIFPSAAHVVLDIGFGDGEALAELATRFPEIGYLGVEVYEPGIGHLLLKLEAGSLNNVRLICADASEVVESHLDGASMDAINLFFPDPWPKKRHFKRRLVQPSFMAQVHRVLVPGGLFHVATDWLPYAEHVDQVLKRCADFEQVPRAQLEGDPVAWRPATKFERRGLALGHEVHDLYYRKR